MFTTNRHTTPLRYIPALLAVAALGLSACSTEELPDNGGNTDGKTAIEFAMSNTGGIGMSLDSRAAASDASRAGFGADTRIVMRIGSQNTDDGSLKYTRTTATASAQVSEGTPDYSTVTFAPGTEMRYWDDAHGRNSQLSVYAVAIPGKTDDRLLPVDKLNFTASTGSNWATENTSTSATNNCIVWEVSADQSAAGTVSNQDLCYSNNIQADEERGKNGVYRYNFGTGSYPTFPGCYENGTIKPGLENGVMKYTTPSASKPGKFDRGHMIFRHALSRITVKLTAGDGFTQADAPFAFTSADGNVYINNVPTSGTFDIANGNWKDVATTSTIKKMEITKDLTADDKSYTLVANLLPGYEIHNGNGTNIIQFELDYNHYNITEAMLYGALYGKAGITQSDATKITMEQGLNYEIGITVKKQGIDNVTATIVNWATVTAEEQYPSNAYITLNLKTFDGTACKGFDFYRLNDPYDTPQIDEPSVKHYKWYTGYNTDGKATLTPVDAAGNTVNENDASFDHYKTNWYYDSNKAFYHFRTVNEGTTITTDAANGDYFSITSSNEETNDPHWGAPMHSSADITYAVSGYATATPPTGGFASSIHWAIGSTKNQIKITELHMLSKINVILKTTDTDDKVTLHDGTTPAIVKLVRYFKDGKVELGRGLVTATSALRGSDNFKSPDPFFEEANKRTNPYLFMAVPQLLSGSGSAGDTDFVGIEITTPDGNVYKINRLSEITAKTVGSDVGQGQTNSDYITRWLPNHHYTYTFTLKKTEVTATATVTKWNEVTADKEDVTIE